MDLETLLFESSPEGKGGPLFKSQVDLAAAVIASGAGGFGRRDKKPDSVRAFINQVFNGKRPLSPNLRKAITAAVRARLASSDEHGLAEALHNLDVAFAALEHQRLALRGPLDDRLEFDALETASERARVHFIITDSPAEVTPSEKADRLRRQLVSNLHLAARPDSEDITRAAHYYFHFPDRSYGIRFWQGVHDFLTGHLGKSGAEVDRLLSTAERSGHLQVFELAPAFLSVFSSVVLDPENKDSRAGFMLYYHDKHRVSVATMPPDVLAKWHEEIYLKICTNCEPFRRTRVRYDEYVSIREERM